MLFKNNARKVDLELCATVTININTINILSRCGSLSILLRKLWVSFHNLHKKQSNRFCGIVVIRIGNFFSRLSVISKIALLCYCLLAVSIIMPTDEPDFNIVSQF